MAAYILVVLCAAMQLIVTPCFGAPKEKTPPPKAQAATPKMSSVTLGGKELFSVLGIGAFSSDERAQAIAGRVKRIAEDLAVRTDSIKTVDADISTDVVTGEMVILSVIDRDGVPAGRTRQDLAAEYAAKIRTTVESYRAEYGREALLYGLIYTVVALVVTVLVIILFNRLFRRLQNLIETRYKEKLHSIHFKTIELVRVERVKSLVDGALRFFRMLVILIIVYSFLHTVLGFFPWTRPFSNLLLDHIIAPLKVIGNGILREIPNLVFLVVMVIITRYVLKIMKMFFSQIEEGTLTFSGFYPEWAKPTERIFRLLIVAFAVIVAFPYIPGSESPAFKGVSLFLGVLFSLGSQSTVSNILAGFTLTYRRLYKVGDRVRIDDIVGDVTMIRVPVTHLKTVKNEEVIIPNSTILNSNVTNYSSLSMETGLILHTTVTIGYDAPWRQVHALLLMAAERTPGLLKDPPPFVFQKSLDDFYVSYELNVYTDMPHAMGRLYSDLHQNIQDCFNEYGVQIMSPNYEADRPEPPIVPKERWYEAPAKPPGSGGQV